ncbi:shikimate dehydrogenase [Alteromonas mediterranea]|uniref:shikimate dehydrogenase n=1 Tax=Alteromonas mediterranea TaxID=314275 RepID=UPI000904479B|nr:shikimate dehydrogenase [Alteromonas mediterranea]APD92533.1 shikimate dehydrogenase [Alteromonas mediterranea]APD96146.1 shikimate dehydrogenase [Alteromonas mediterranea]QDG36746.1 shikimate dehydrogenase [Alteromonas mediterranea]QGX63766.1 shikimate dehydrogenase [Alteromonas mediterranea]
MKKFAVFGNPIAQSLSPTIHQMFADQVGEKISYEKILAPEDGFVEAAKAFLAQEGAVGCNVTMPFKLDAFNLAKVDDQAAKDAQAVNTLMNGDRGELLGFNTDGVGLVNDLLNSGVEIQGKRVLLIGAGGAARGVISPLLKAGAATLTIANRTKAKAEEVASAASNPKVDVVALEDIATIAPHIIINSTAASLSNALPCSLNDGVLQHCEVVYDMVYKNSPTRFMRDAAELGVKTQIDGLGMLVEQAAEAFYIWTQKRPDTSDIVKQVRDIVEQSEKRN